jgi:hypothetical protein
MNEFLKDLAEPTPVWLTALFYLCFFIPCVLLNNRIVELENRLKRLVGPPLAERQPAKPSPPWEGP